MLPPTLVDPPPSDALATPVLPSPLFSPTLKQKMFYRKVQKDETRAQTYLSKGATLLHVHLKTNPESHAGFMFSSLPAGYELFEHNNDTRRDVYLYGHPSGKRFRSVLEFVPHLIWLATGRTSACECFACGGIKKRKTPKTSRTAKTTPMKTTPKKLSYNPTIVINDDDISDSDIVVNSVPRKRTKLDATAFATSSSTKLPSPIRINAEAAPSKVNPIRIDSESPDLVPLLSPPKSSSSSSRITGITVENAYENSKAKYGSGRVGSGTASSSIRTENIDESIRNAYETVKAKNVNVGVGSVIAQLPPPTTWDGILHYRGSPIHVTASVLEVSKDNEVVYPIGNRSQQRLGACPLFAAFPLKMNLRFQIPAAKLRWMIAAAQEYITESRKVSSLSWAYRIIVMPSEQPVHRERFDELNSALNDSYGASVFVKQDGLQVLLTPAGNYLTGYAMLEEAFPNWAEGSTLPLL